MDGAATVTASRQAELTDVSIVCDVRHGERVPVAGREFLLRMMAVLTNAPFALRSCKGRQTVNHRPVFFFFKRVLSPSAPRQVPFINPFLHQSFSELISTL